MTPAAKASEYVTYEWAFAWGAGIKVIPILLKETELHPRLETLQNLDFTNRNARPWDALIELLHEAQSSKPQEGQPVHRVHEYSGAWDVENRFSRWRDYELGVNDTVYWHGKTFLLLSSDGKKGSGIQVGKLYVSIGKYKATYDNVNRINRADVTEDRTLQMDLQVLSRICVEEEGEPSEARFREGLFGSGEYHLELKPVPGISKRLQGKHIYMAGNKVYQQAEETHEYLGF